MKKVLLSSLIIFSTMLSVFAYETIIIKFPDKELWVRGYYQKTNAEAILMYVPYGQKKDNWRRAIVVHSYKDSFYPINTFLSNSINRLKKVNPLGTYKTLKINNDDAMVGRCTENYKNIEGQCEFFRVTRGYEGTVTIHYMNKNKEEFMNNYREWYNIIKQAKLYNSYYRDERTFDKAEYFEL